jgi:hypothetical protein
MLASFNESVLLLVESFFFFIKLKSSKEIGRESDSVRLLITEGTKGLIWLSFFL